ncbi:melanoma-associated antigen B4-like [Talpa occidentalis]|uniref:melanoma-associated antigen B4-like n=1 Tax=Talpa occidentalis TaxID=50954 RepID=UPI00188E9DFD|nr:melanoma-associated antigen B4-like [Talpa occidentalis]
MPRGQKSKLRARKKRHQARGETQSLSEAQAQAQTQAQAQAASAEGEKSSPPSSPAAESEAAPPGSPAADPPQEPKQAQGPRCPDAGASCPGAHKGAQGQEAASGSTSQAAASMETYRKDPLTRKASMLVQFLLQKYKSKEPITQAALLKVVKKKYKKHFPEILRRAADRMDLVCGLELKKVNTSYHSYTLASKMAIAREEDLVGSAGLPKTGFLLALLGVIFMKGNRASEEQVWDFLHVLGVHAGKRHLIFGDPRKFITQDLVRDKYLEYRQVPGSDPPTYEFLWGPRAHVETTKMQVLKVLAKLSNTTPSAFPDLYKEALFDEADRACMRFAARAGTTAKAYKSSGAQLPISPRT